MVERPNFESLLNSLKTCASFRNRRNSDRSELPATGVLGFLSADLQLPEMQMRRSVLRGGCLFLIGLLIGGFAAAAEPPSYERDISPLLKLHCVKCHGPAKHEGKLDLSVAGAVARGGKQGAVLVPHDIAASLLWQRVESDEMPPEMPLTDKEKGLLKAWIIAGAPGLPAKATNASPAAHWAFQPTTQPDLPAVRDRSLVLNPVDEFIQAKLETQGLSLSPLADRYARLRRVAFDLTGLPPTPADIAAFVTDDTPEAYSKIVDRYLASPAYGERLGKVWLDAAGYADSNGYFNADSDRPLAYRYRDWVIRSLNRDLPYDQFVREQLAGDELVHFVPDQDADPETIERLEATHYLRNSQDGTGESDGNDDEVRIDRYTVLEGAMQNISSSLLGMTVQCAKCHDHKFEPITQRDYYAFQAVLSGIYAPTAWKKPNERIVYASRPGEFAAWQAATEELDRKVKQQQAELSAWVRAHRPHGQILFEDNFQDTAASLPLWSNATPGDTVPAGKVPVHLNESTAPSLMFQEGRLLYNGGGTQGSSGFSTKDEFDWTPDAVGSMIQVTFDLVDNKLTADGTPAIRIGYFIAMKDFNDATDLKGGNVLIDGNPTSGSVVYVDYPGGERVVGPIGTTTYMPGHNYGVRVTNQGEDKYLLQHLHDGIPDEKTITLSTADLPNGGFGFEMCCDRAGIIDNVIIETFASATNREVLASFQKELQVEQKPLEETRQAQTKLSQNRPGKMALATDISTTPPATHLLVRGNYTDPGPAVDPAPFQLLIEPDAPFEVKPSADPMRTTGRRLAFANWMTRPASRAAGLLARVHANRLWQHHFGVGLVATPENLGISGAPPSHPELLDWLASELVRTNWDTKHVHRLILKSGTYQQSSATDEGRLKGDADGRLLSRFPVRRLDAEAIRDAMLAVSGDLDPQLGGPYIPSTRQANGEVTIAADHPQANRRSVYLQQRRSQVLSMLQVFDAPSIVFNSTRRPRSTMPLQSLSLLNSEFAVSRAQHLANRLQREYPSEPERLAAALLITSGRPADEEQRTVLIQFLDQQLQEYAGQADSRQRAWVDLCQMLLAGNSFLYLD